MLDYMTERYPLTRPDAGVLASLAVDLRITQVVNGTVGVHALLPPDAFSA
jgi:acetamidase/formamidase